MKRAILVSTSIALVGLAIWLAVSKENFPGHESETAGGERSRNLAPVANREANDHQTKARNREKAAELTMPRKTLNELLDLLASLNTPEGFNQKNLDQMRSLLKSLEPEELLEVQASLDASNASGQFQLVIMVAAALGAKDPQMAMDEFSKRLPKDSGALLIQLEMIYVQWLAKDTAAATAWLDGQIADGKLLPIQREKQTRHPRRIFESAVVRQLVKTNPELAATRFSTWDEESRNQSFSSSWFSGTNDAEAKNVADFLRLQSANDPSVLAKTASLRLRQSDLEGAAAFVDTIEPSREERAALIGEALRSRIQGQEQVTITPEEARAWILNQAPLDAGQLTGNVLGQYTEWFEFPELVALAKAYDGGKGEVLTAFLTTAPARFRKEILELTSGLPDPEAKARVENRFRPQ